MTILTELENTLHCDELQQSCLSVLRDDQSVTLSVKKKSKKSWIEENLYVLGKICWDLMGAEAKLKIRCIFLTVIKH